jgi:hypothetical protein
MEKNIKQTKGGKMAKEEFDGTNATRLMSDGQIKYHCCEGQVVGVESEKKHPKIKSRSGRGLIPLEEDMVYNSGIYP